MPVVTPKCFVGGFSVVLVGLFVVLVYLMATIDPVPAGYVVKNISTADTQPAAPGPSGRRENLDDMDETLFTIEGLDKAPDGVVYGPFPLVFDDMSKNGTLRSADGHGQQMVYPPLVPLIEVKGNKTRIQTMLLSMLTKNKLEPKSYPRRSADNWAAEGTDNRTIEVKIVDESGITVMEIKVPVDPSAGDDNITVVNDLTEAGYSVIINGKSFKKINASLHYNHKSLNESTARMKHFTKPENKTNSRIMKLNIGNDTKINYPEYTTVIHETENMRNISENASPMQLRNQTIHVSKNTGGSIFDTTVTDGSNLSKTTFTNTSQLAEEDKL